MFRRVALSVTTPALAATALSSGCVARFQSSAAATGDRRYNNNNNQGGRRRNNNNNNRQRMRRALMPPAFDIVHWNDADITKGYLLRVLHRENAIVLDYHRQVRGAPASADDASEAAAEGTGAPVGNRAERVVAVQLPPVYIARFLGVLEGRMDKAEVQSRYTNATFAPDTAKGPHHYSLQCVSTKPTTGQQQNVDGTDVNEESISWNVELDPAESLMLHRFLSQALQYNSGFIRRIF